MQPVRITIPPVNKPIENSAAEIVIQRLRMLGADPLKMAKNEMGRTLCQMWTRGECTTGQFDHTIRILLILNPSLELKAS